MSNRTCSIDGCDKPHRARGLCRSHYKIEHERHDVTCASCGEGFRSTRPGGKYCSDTCKGADYKVREIAPPRTPKQERRTREIIREMYPVQPQPLRMAVEDEDWPTVLREMQARVTIEGDCWVWPKLGPDGYPRVRIAKRSVAAHRLVAMAVRGQVIPPHMPVHHKCARPACVSPTHLQVVTPHENTAEMLERNYYTKRIAELEAALRDAAPGHPLLPASDLAS